MQTLHVELGDRRYPIFIGSDLNPQELLEPYIKGRQVMIVTNMTVAPLYLDRYVRAVEALGKIVETCILPDGEKYKNIEHLTLIFDALLKVGFNRDCTVLALGGGVIGDMAGFASASFQRGVYFVQVTGTRQDRRGSRRSHDRSDPENLCRCVSRVCRRLLLSVRLLCQG